MCVATSTLDDHTTSTRTTSGCMDCALSGRGGTSQYRDDAVEVSTGVRLTENGTPLGSDAIQMRVKCDKNPHVLQFVNREIIRKDGTPDSRLLTTKGGTYNTTTDPKNPVWRTDTGGKPSPYYEKGPHAVACNCPGELIVWDQPSLAPAAGSGETWRANFSAFIICDGKVIRRVDWTRSQTDGGQPSYSVNVTNATSLPQWATDTMSAQGFTYP